MQATLNVDGTKPVDRQRLTAQQGMAQSGQRCPSGDVLTLDC